MTKNPKETHLPSRRSSHSDCKSFALQSQARRTPSQPLAHHRNLNPKPLQLRTLPLLPFAMFAPSTLSRCSSLPNIISLFQTIANTQPRMCNLKSASGNSNFLLCLPFFTKMTLPSNQSLFLSHFTKMPLPRNQPNHVSVLHYGARGLQLLKKHFHLRKLVY